MKKLLPHFLLLICLTLIIFSCSEDAEPEVPEIVEVQETIEALELYNVPYGTDNRQVYDIYLPENRNENTKVIILIHGGGWVSGDKVSMLPYVVTAKEELPNYAFVNINYRLASEGVSPFPMQLDDITAVINHLKINKDEYLISEDYGFIGISAGAHLAMLWSYAYNFDNNVNMVASIVGPTNFKDPNYEDFVDPTFVYFNITPSDSILEQYSPYYNVSASSPPTILFYGGNDPLIPNTQGIDMDVKLAELNVAHEFTFYEEEGHGWVGDNLLDTWEKIIAFINTHH